MRRAGGGTYIGRYTPSDKIYSGRVSVVDMLRQKYIYTELIWFALVIVCSAPHADTVACIDIAVRGVIDRPCNERWN